MTPLELRELASQLGYGWQTKLARLLPCEVRTVRHWLKGTRAISPLVKARIKDVVKMQLNSKLKRKQ